MSSQGVTLTGLVMPSSAPPSGGGNYDALIEQSAQQYNLDPILLRRQMMGESAGDPNALSPKGASGLMQIMPGTAGDLGVDPTIPEQAIPGGARYMRQLLDRYDNHYPTALAAYNWGMGNVDRQGFSNAPPETRKYTNGIVGYDAWAGAQAMAMPPPANTQGGGDTYVNADGTIASRYNFEAPAAPQVAVTDLVMPEAPPAPTDTAPMVTNLVMPEAPAAEANPLQPVPQLPVTPPQWGPQAEAPPVNPGATNIPNLGQAPPNLAQIFAPPPPPVPVPTPRPEFVPPAPPVTAQAYGAEIQRREQDAQRAAMTEGPLADPTKPEAGWGKTLSETAQQVVPSMQKAGGGIMRLLGENQLGSPMAGPGVRMTGEQLEQNAKIAPEMAKSAGTPGTLANTGKKISEEAEKAILLHTPNVHRGSAKDIANKVGVGVAETVPALLASIGMGDPAPIVVHAFGTSLGNNYADEMKKNPNDPHGAAAKAASLATIDAAAAAIGVKAFGYEPFKGVSGTITNDMTGEVATFTRQSISNTIKNLTVQGVGIQPAISLVNHGIDNAINGRPVTEGMGEAYVTGAISNTLISGLAHLGTRPSLTRVGKFEKPMGEAYGFNPEGLHDGGIDTQFTGGRPKPQTMQLPSGPVQPPPGEKPDAIVPAAKPSAVAPEAPATGESVVPISGSKGPPLPAGDGGDQAGGGGIAPVSGSGVSAAPASADGNVPAEPIAAAAFTGPQAEPVTAPKEFGAAPDAEPHLTVPQKYVDAAKAEGARDPTGLWFLDGQKQVYMWNGTAEKATAVLGHRALELDSYPSVSNDHATVWYKPGEKERAKHLLELGAQKDALNAADPERMAPGRLEKFQDLNTATGHALGYHPQAVERYTDAWREHHGLAPLERASSEAPAPTAGEAQGPNLPEPQFPQTKTPAFKKWFGESKVTDEQGEPMTLYHGTVIHEAPKGTNARPLGDIETFDRSAAQNAFNRPENADAIGSWFSESPHAGYEGTKFGAGAYAGKDGAVYPVHVRIENPWRAKNLHELFDEMHKAAGRDPTKQNPRGQGSVTELRDRLKAQGYDGIYFPAGTVDSKNAAPVWVAFDPEQIKSAVGNRGTFSNNSPNILHEKTGATTETVAPSSEALGQDEPLSQPGGTEVSTKQDVVPEDEEIALSPQEQSQLDWHEADIKDKNQRLDNLKAAGYGDTQQFKSLSETRDKSAGKRDELLAKRRKLRRRPKIDLSAPRSDLAPRTFEDYKFQHGIPVYRDAYYEMALNGGASPEEAEHFADRAMQLETRKQVEMLRAKVKEKFEFQDVVIGKMTDYEARNALLDFHRAAQDMMHALEYPTRMASLMGTVKLELHPLTNQSKGYGSYEWSPTERKIVLNGRSNVFGHEWTHAKDHFIVDYLKNQASSTGYLATQLARAGKLDPTDDLATRMGSLLNTLFHDEGDLALKRLDLEIKAKVVNKAGKPTPAAKKAQTILEALKTGTAVKGVKASPFLANAEMFGPKGYWDTAEEMLARAGESYLAYTMEKNGLDPRGVLLSDKAYQSNADKRLKMTFPTDGERMKIFQAFDHLYDGFRQTALGGSIKATQAMRGGMSDPQVWGKLNTTQPFTPLKTLVHRMRNWRETLNRTKLTDPNRPDPGAHHLRARAALLAKEEFFGRLSLLQAMHELAPNAQAADAYQKIIDRIGHEPGKGRYTGWDTIEEAAHVQEREWMRLFSNSLANAGFDPETMSTDDKDKIRHAMTTGDKTYPLNPTDPNGPRVPIDPKLAKVAGELSDINSMVFDRLKDAGMNIGFAKSGYFPRLYDQVRAFHQAMKFITQASKMYRRMFDEEVGDPGDYPDKLLEKWSDLNQLEKSHLSQTDNDGMKDLKTNLAAQAVINAAIDDGTATPAQRTQLGQLETAAEALAQAHHDAVGNLIASINANLWHSDLVSNYSHDLEKNIPGGRYLNARSLPPYADQYMRDFMHTDLLQVLPHYYASASRKVAYTDRFGVGGTNGKVRDALIKQLQDAGVSPVDIHRTNKIIDSVSGRTNNDNSRADVKMANNIQASAAVAMMGRSAFTMWAEPFVGALHTGQMRTGFENLAGAIGQFMRTASAQERTQLADLIGVTTSAIQEDILNNRIMPDYSDSPMVGKFMAQYYRMTWITGITNASKRGSIRGHNWVLSHWSRVILNQSNKIKDQNDKAEAHAMFNELGIDPTYHDKFAEWMAKQDGLPNLSDPANADFASTYARAMRRLSKRTIIDTDKIQKPLPTDDKWRGMMYQFLNYSYGMQDNVLDVMSRRIQQTYRRNYDRNRKAGAGPFTSGVRGTGYATWALGYTGAVVLAYLLASAPQTILREYLFNKPTWDKHEAEGDLGAYLAELVMDRSALGGIFQAPMEIFASLRYHTDPASVFNGAGPSWLGKNIGNALSPITSPSGETSNAKYHNMVIGLYNLLAVPLEAWTATKVAGFGPAGVAAAGLGYAFASSPGASEKVATALTGPKGTEIKPPKLDEDGDPIEDDDEVDPDEAADDAADAQADQEDSGTAAEGKEGTSPASQSWGAAPLGLLDDILVPAWKAIKPIYGLVPGKVKAAVALGMAATAAGHFWNKTEPFRNAPPKVPKPPKEEDDEEGETP